MKSRSIGILTVGASLFFAAAAQAQTLQQSLFPTDLVRSLRYGSGVEVDENTLVVVDRGFRAAAPDSCGIDTGAVHIYRRPSWTAPWPSTPNQTFVGNAVESHFGEQVWLRGNRLLIAESRYPKTGTSDDGGIHYYTRANATAPFVKVTTMTDYRNNTSLTLPGMVSNGRFVVGVSSAGGDPTFHVFGLHPWGVESVSQANNPQPPFFQNDGIGITDNDIVVVVHKGHPGAKLYKVTHHSWTALNASALLLTNGPGEADHVYTGQVEVRGNDVVLATKRRSTLPAPNDLTTYSLRVINLDGGVVSTYGEAEIPDEFSLNAGYSVATRGLELARGPVVLANVAGTNMHTLGFEYANGQFELAMDIDMELFNPQAGSTIDPNYTTPVAFDGRNVYVGDIFDETFPPGPPCGYSGGSVRIFSADFGNNPSTICAGDQNVFLKVPPVQGATAYQWWSNGSTSIIPSGPTALVDFSASFTQATVSVGVNLNQAPWFTTLNIPVTAKPCGSTEPAFVDGHWYACSAGQNYEYFTTPIAGATYTWSSPGSTNITAYGPAAQVDFKPNFLSTTVKVAIQFSQAPYYVERSLVVNQMACGRFP